MLELFRKFKKKEPGQVVLASPTRKMKKNNAWYHHNADSETVIVFVHGFLSNSESCWTSRSGKYWPDIILEDIRFGGPALFLGGYHTSYDSGEYKLWDCTKELFDALERNDPQGRSSPLSYQNILFVCHSLGGIVTRNMLEANTDKFKLKNIGLALMASPSVGSEYANKFSYIINFYKNGIAKQLQSINDTLEELDINFRTLIEDKKIPLLVGGEAIEHKSPFKIFLLPSMSPIVKRYSASRYFSFTRIIPKTTHSSIVKPESVDDHCHTFLLDFYEHKFKPQIIKMPQCQSNEAHKTSLGDRFAPTSCSLENQVLFDIYSPNCAPYYSLRKIDKDILSTSLLYSIWLSGPSGCGKTSAIRHMLYEQGHKPLDVCLSSCYGELTSERLIAEIAATASQLNGTYNKPERTLNGLAGVLAEYSKQSRVVLYLDEVPIAGGNTEAIEFFVNFIAILLDSVKRLSGRADVRFVISSIVVPTIATGNPGKFAEHMRSLAMSPWTMEELELLLVNVLSYLKIDGFDQNDRNEMLKSAKGSPRFLKMYLKNRFLCPEIGHIEILAMTIQQTIS